MNFQCVWRFNLFWKKIKGGQKVLIKTSEHIQISTLKCGISSFDIANLDLNAESFRLYLESFQKPFLAYPWLDGILDEVKYYSLLFPDFPYIRQVIDIISFNISNDTSFYEKNEKKRLCIVLVIRTKNTIYDKKKELQTFKQKECSSFWETQHCVVYDIMQKLLCKFL